MSRTRSLPIVLLAALIGFALGLAGCAQRDPTNPFARPIGAREAGIDGESGAVP